MNQTSMKTVDKRCFGDIILADVLFTDGQWSKLRPVLVLYNNEEDYTILKISSQSLSWDIIRLPMDDGNNLRADSMIDLKKISTFHETLFVKKRWTITQEQKILVQQYRSTFVTWWN